ncbi:hypothetical protein NQ314_019979 [Rhamnusium bicolor]|uniref:Uncharacterized protein n=1 Tax=Rhamnusium bicolor TaxID=1586634 RepID=A0AAV8WMG5_9CUCU|nr:hypothetical protein NQ314_019979 [Rhamnusium bicolor]
MLLTWSDYKYNLKRKAAALKQNIEKTGGGPSEEKDLTELELKLLDMLGEHFIGLEEPECGLPTSSAPFISEEPQPGTSKDDTPAPITLSPSKERIAAKRKIINPLYSPKKKQRVEHQSEYRETINELRDIKTTIKKSLDGISQHLSDLTSEFRQINVNLADVGD